MNKRRYTQSFFISFVLVIICSIVIYGINLYNDNKISFDIANTLATGNNTKVKVILLGGQSNASGCSSDEYLKMKVSEEKYAEYEQGYDNVYINYFVSGNNVSNGFVKCSTKQGELGNYFGPELGLAEVLHETYPDQLFFIIKWAWGGTNLFEQWLSPSSKGKTGKLYNQFVKYVETSLEYLVSKDYDISIEGMCWMQGESDSFSVKHAKGYETNLTNFIKDIRKKFFRYESNDGIAFIDADIADNPVYWVYCEYVNKSKHNLLGVIDSYSLIDTNAHGLTVSLEPVDNPDMAHYDSLSEIKLGNLFAEELIKYFD